MGILSGIEHGGEEFLTGAYTAPTPQVNGKPSGPVQPAKWTAPDVSGNGQITVQRDHLTTASDVLKQNLPELNNAITAVQQLYGSFDCLSSWPAGQAMCQNLLSAVEGFATTGQQTSDAHAATAQNLSDTAGTYEDAETSNLQAINGIGSQSGQSGGSGGSASAGSGNWS